jgi:hypothetical protein
MCKSGSELMIKKNRKADEEKARKALPPHIDHIVNEIMEEDKVLLEKLSKD